MKGYGDLLLNIIICLIWGITLKDRASLRACHQAEEGKEYIFLLTSKLPSYDKKTQTFAIAKMGSTIANCNLTSSCVSFFINITATVTFNVTSLDINVIVKIANVTRDLEGIWSLEYNYCRLNSKWNFVVFARFIGECQFFMVEDKIHIICPSNKCYPKPKCGFVLTFQNMKHIIATPLTDNSVMVASAPTYYGINCSYSFATHNLTQGKYNLTITLYQHVNGCKNNDSIYTSQNISILLENKYNDTNANDFLLNGNSVPFVANGTEIYRQYAVTILSNNVFEKQVVYNVKCVININTNNESQEYNETLALLYKNATCESWDLNGIMNITFNNITQTSPRPDDDDQQKRTQYFVKALTAISVFILYMALAIYAYFSNCFSDDTYKRNKKIGNSEVEIDNMFIYNIQESTIDGVYSMIDASVDTKNSQSLSSMTIKHGVERMECIYTVENKMETCGENPKNEQLRSITRVDVNGCIYSLVKKQ